MVKLYVAKKYLKQKLNCIIKQIKKSVIALFFYIRVHDNAKLDVAQCQMSDIHQKCTYAPKNKQPNRINNLTINSFFYYYTRQMRRVKKEILCSIRRNRVNNYLLILFDDNILLSRFQLLMVCMRIKIYVQGETEMMTSTIKLEATTSSCVDISQQSRYSSLTVFIPHTESVYFFCFYQLLYYSL